MIEIRHYPLPTEISPAHWSYLSREEKEKAERFLFPKDQARYVFCRGMLRQILSSYIGCAPGAIFFSYNEWGKPRLAHPLKFNLSHTHDLAVFAFSSVEIGIDVEKVKPLPDLLAIAKAFFSEEEYLHLENLDEAERTRVFYALWTKKEALLKALGLGLGKEEILKQMSQKEHRLLDSLWQVRELDLAAGYSCAIAYEGEERSIEYVTYIGYSINSSKMASSGLPSSGATPTRACTSLKSAFI